MKKVSLENSLEALLAAVEQHKNEFPKILILFTGSLDNSGRSWCPDCVSAHPVIEKALDSYQAKQPDEAKKTLFLTVFVGERNVWKDRDNVFRKSKFAVRSVPTLLKQGTGMRLEENQCRDSEMVSMLIEED